MEPTSLSPGISGQKPPARGLLCGTPHSLQTACLLQKPFGSYLEEQGAESWGQEEEFIYLFSVL